MTYFEPMVFAQPLVGKTNSYNFINHKMNGEIFKSLGYQYLSTEYIRELINEHIENAFSSLGFDTELQSKLQPEYPFAGVRFPKMAYNENCMIISDPFYTQQMYLVSPDRKTAKREIAAIESQAEKLEYGEMKLGETFEIKLEKTFYNRDVDGFGDPFLLRGAELADYLTSRICKPAAINDETDNHLESKIVSDIQHDLSTAIMTNADLLLSSEPAENREYDILLHVTPRSRIYIEVKSVYSAVGSGEDIDWKKQLIGKPFQYTALLDRQAVSKASRQNLGWKSRTECVVVVDGLPERRFQNYKEMAERRDIMLLERDRDGKYLEEIADIIRSMLHEFTKPLECDDPLNEIRYGPSL